MNWCCNDQINSKFQLYHLKMTFTYDGTSIYTFACIIVNTVLCLQWSTDTTHTNWLWLRLTITCEWLPCCTNNNRLACWPRYRRFWMSKMTPANSAFRFRYKGWDGIVPHINSSSTCMMLYIYVYLYGLKIQRDYLKRWG